MDKNYDVIGAKYPVLRERYLKSKDQDFIEENKRVYIDSAVDGTDIVTFEIDGRYRYVNSRYEPLKEAGVWAEQFADINPQEIVIIMGLGNGYHVRELLKLLGSTNCLIIVEPNPAMFQMVMSEFDISDIISDNRVLLEVKGISDGVYNESLQNLLNFSNFRLVRFSYLPNYDKIYADEYLELYTQYKAAAELIVLDRNTHIKYSDEFIVNVLKNYKSILHQRTITGLKQQFARYDLTGIPAIIVSAGPSLEKNVKELKAAEGKSFLIVVDTALKPVLNAGITPDISVIVDPHKPLILFNNEKIKDIPMVASHQAHYKVLEKQQAPIFYFGQPTEYISSFYRKYAGLVAEGLDTGGSVAHNAFSLASYLGFQTIILVGQDLAFSGEKSHAEGAYTKKVDRNLMLETSESCMVEDIYGNMVETMKNMEVYLRWFEKQFSIHPELKVIDATEGGAKKKGAEMMTLKDAIARECRKEFDAAKAINAVKRTFSDEDISKIYEEFRDIPNQIHALKKKMDDGIRTYYRFEELYRKGKTGTSEFKKTVDRIGKVNLLMDNEPISELVGIYSMKDNFEVVQDMFEYKQDEKEEIHTIVEKGVRMLKTYKKASDKLLEDIHILLDSIP